MRKRLILLLGLGCLLPPGESIGYTCPPGESKKTITLGVGDSVDFSTQDADYYGKNVKCVVKFKKAKKAKCELNFSCSKFFLDAKNSNCHKALRCKGCDVLKIGKAKYCHYGPHASHGPHGSTLNVLFRSMKRSKGGKGAECEATCVDPDDWTPTTVAPTIGCQNEGEGGLFGLDYEGNASKTVSGLTCQKWSDPKPHNHKQYKYNKNKYKDVGEHNFCRNPGANHKVVWCFTTHKWKIWQPCDVPKCDIDCQAGDGKYYKGEVNKTGSGKDCQVWAEQKPHKHKHKDVGENNFCRNPDNHDAVWCYTTDKKKRWEECNVPKC